MFFVIKNNIDKNGNYVSAEIVAHSTDVVSPSGSILENAAMTFIAYEGGRGMLENIKIIDVHSLNQVAEPLIDTMLLYRVTSEPNKIHVYRRVSKEVPGYVFGQTIVPEFTRIKVFELVEYSIDIQTPQQEVSNTEIISPIENVDIKSVQVETYENVDIKPTQVEIHENIDIKPIQVKIHPAIVIEQIETHENIDIKPIQVEMHPAIIAEQIKTVCKNSEMLKQRPIDLLAPDLLASLESSPKFLKMKEKND